MSNQSEFVVNEDRSTGIDIAEGQQVMPFYLILDQSGSMDDDLDNLRQAVEQIIAKLRSDAETDDTALLGVISFGSTAHVTIPLSRLSDITAVPQLQPLGGTEYGAAWRAYDQAVRADTAQIKLQNGSFHRPCVFFLTDGEPHDLATFRDVFLSTQGKEAFKAWPYVIAYGFRKARPEVLKELAYPNFGEKLGEYFLLRDSDPQAVIEQVKGLVNQTVLRATSANAQGKPDLRAARPAPEQNIERGTTDSVDETF